jgi:hypothetical protein
MLVAALAFAVPARAEGQRFALVVGVNRGLEAEETLRFAENDAHRVAAALTEVGGVPAQNVTTLVAADADMLRAALARLRVSMGPGPQERLVVYVSSHAGDGALHLSGSELALEELVRFLKEAPVRVGVLVVDACQSGRVAQLKGLKASEIPLMRLEATGVEGRVFISASGADEYAQESEALQGSYFTHYFLSGLRGAADVSRDGRVTLEEAYGWAWARTVEATFSSRGGVQRPAFSVDLRGQGQLVLAETTQHTSRLILNVRAPGRFLVVDRETGLVFADVEKREGPISLAVPPGGYRVQLRSPDAAREQTVVVPARGAASLSDEHFERAALVRVVRKGGEEATLVMSASGGIASGLAAGLTLQPGLELRFRREGHLVGLLNQFVATLGWRDGQALAGEFSQTEFELRLGVGHRFSWRAASLSLGLEAGPLLVLQSKLPDGSGRTSLGLASALVIESRVRLLGPLEVLLAGTGGGDVVKLLSGVALVPRVSASAGLALRF